MSESNGPEKSGRGPIRLGLVQFDAKVENVDYNVQRVKDRIASLEPGTVDLLCLPEMSFTGYVFPTADSIRPFVEGPEGPSRAACAEIAQRLKCYVVAGYPAPTLTLKESEDQSGEGKSNETQETTAKVEGVARNNAIVVDPSGNVIHEYTKTNMFEADLPWAQPGSGFSTFSTPLEALGTISVAICMDLNPHPPNVWNSAEEGPYELADYCIERNVQTLILLCAWLDSDNEPEDTQFDAQTVSYWIARLRPLWHSGSDKYTVVICNRTGKERGSTFAGSSTVLRSQTDKQLPKILTVMGRDEEAVRVVDLE